MVEFEKEALEVTKYTDLVKLAKQHDVYRRYAPKTELIEKLMALCKSPVETLNDVSMPSFMETDGTESEESEHDTENLLALVSSIQGCKGTSPAIKPKRASYSSPRNPLIDKEKNFNRCSSVIGSLSPMVKSKPNTPQALRKSLAGPAKSTIKNQKLRREGTFEIETKSTVSAAPDPSSTRRMTRQQTFEVEESDNKMKREKTFDIETNSKVVQETVQIKQRSTVSHTRMLRREGTFEIAEVKLDAEQILDNSQSCSLRREGTFEVEETSNTKRISRVMNRKSCANSAGPTTPYDKSVNQKSVNGKSVPRRFITSRVKPVGPSPGTKSPAIKSRIQSVVNQIEKNKLEVSAKKMSEATAEKPVQSKKIPDFNAIHKRLFDKMESLVDSRQKVIDKASSMQKSQLKSDQSKRSPPNKKVVRKLLSPKAGKSNLTGAKSRLPTLKAKLPTLKAKLPTPKSKLPTPKTKLPTPKLELPTTKTQLPTPKSKLLSPKSRFATPRSKAAFQQVASEYASNIVCIQKRPSINSLVPGVSKLQSPKFEAKGKSSTSHFGFAKTEHLRKETLKASVMAKTNIKRNSPMAKAKQALQSVRLNKRFELQMKHRMAQQEHGI